jgi:hypothetical protein
MVKYEGIKVLENISPSGLKAVIPIHKKGVKKTSTRKIIPTYINDTLKIFNILIPP